MDVQKRLDMALVLFVGRIIGLCIIGQGRPKSTNCALFGVAKVTENHRPNQVQEIKTSHNHSLRTVHYELHYINRDQMFHEF